MAVIVEPVLTEEKLRVLLAEGHEQSCLDYKRRLDLNQRGEIIELAKDVAAMQSEPSGGYIVVGADDRGTLVPDLTPEQARLFDEATVRPKLAKYLAEPLTIRTAQHELDGHIVVLIYVAPNVGGWCIFAADGEYEVAGKKKIIFRVGDVFVRHGTSSERWNEADRQRLIERVVAQLKEAWRTEIRHELAAITETNLSAQALEQLPSAALTWQLDAEGFESLVTELMRRGDDIPLRQFLLKIPAEAARLGEQSEELATLLDRLTTVGALALEFGRHEWLDRALAAFVRIYSMGFDSNGFERQSIPIVQLWLAVIARIYALGGLAVRVEDWGAVRVLADRRPRAESFNHYGSWLRHALTQAARANLLETDRQSGLIARAHNVVRALSATHPDSDGDDEAILDSLCQFDALGCLVVIGERNSLDSGTFYPSFARYYSRRSEPALVGIVNDAAMRHQLFDGDDEQLANAIVAVASRASKEGFPFGGWNGIHDRSVNEFVQEHGTLQEP